MPAFAVAGDLRWQQLPDRERITIDKEGSEGIAGQIARIDAKGLLIPYTEVPSGVYVQTPPEGAKIFGGTRVMGRALAVITQTNEFGFVVAEQTNDKVIIDLFHDPLGARWKPSEKPPTTDVAPNYATKDYGNTPKTTKPEERDLPAPAVTWGNAAHPFQNVAEPGPVPTVTPNGTIVDNTKVPLVLEGNPGATEHQQSTLNTSTPTLSNSLPDASPPKTASEAVQTPSSLPVVGGQVSSTPEVNKAPAPSVVVMPTSSPSNPEPLQHTAGGAILDTRQETAQRRAPLPEPGPVSLTPEVPQLSSATLPPASPPEPLSAKQQTGHSPAVASQGQRGNAQAQSSAPVATASVPANTPQQVQSHEPERSEAPTTEAMPGLGLREKSAYSGKINTGGPDSILNQLNNKKNTQTSGTSAAGGISPASQRGAESSTVKEGPVAHPISDVGLSQPTGKNSSGEKNSAEGASGGHSSENAANQPQAQAHGKSLEPPVASNATSPEIIYVDEKGNKVEPPADPALKLAEIRKQVTSGEYAKALEGTELLLAQDNLNREQREEALHIKAEMLFMVHKDSLDAGYTAITDATNEAINYNPKSSRNAAALLRLGYLNLKLNNIPEAEARFNLLRRQFPDDENVPLSYYYWGDYFYNKNEMQRAADQFQFVLQRFPDSRYARESALGLARAYYRLGYYEQSFTIVQYIEKKWDHFYITYPPFLNMMGDVSFRLNNFDYALKHYWLYSNLEPNGEETDIILTRIGDIYTIQQHLSAAKEVYETVVRRFPDRDGSLISLMRLAESAINDDPTISGMFNSFDNESAYQPEAVYTQIINDHPKSGLVPLAMLKLAMWNLWNHEYIKALDTTNDFLKKFPADPLASKAKEVAMKTFAVLAAESVENGTYSQMRQVWERYPILHSQEEILTPESRIALGVSYWNDGHPDEALKAVEPFFLGNKIPKYSEMALNLALNIYLDYSDQWSSIENVAKRVQLWNLSPEAQTQLDYALALARENLGKTDAAAQLWQKLYDAKKLPDDQMAYAVYFLARDAEKRKNKNEAYLLGREALDRLKAEADKNPQYADKGKIASQLWALMSLTENSGQLGESLAYANEYLAMLAKDDTNRVGIEYSIARIYKKQGNIDGWRDALKGIAESSPDSVYGRTAASELRGEDLQKNASSFAPTGSL